ncbi:hypothetical protein HN011_003262, partial [Eciton burchellii]
ADNNETLGEFHTVVNIDEKDYPMHAQVVADRLIEHELLLGTDFLNSAQVKINAGEIIIEASEDEEIREVCQLDVIPDKVNNMDGTHVLNTEYQDATESLVDERKSEKVSCVLAMEKAQRDETDIERIFDLREKRGIDVGIERGVMPSREVDNDMRIVVPVSLKPRVIRQTHERQKHCSVARTGAIWDEECQNPSIRDEIRKK